jgi:hypothetical protein
MATKQKPNYTKFMKKPVPLQMSPQRPHDNSGSIPRVPGAAPVRKDNKVPWGEIIIEAEPVYDAEVYFQGEPLFASQGETADPGWNPGIPPLPALAMAVVVLILLSL